MKELKCPRCKNEELKGNENYCPICGLDLKDRSIQRPITPIIVKIKSANYLSSELAMLEELNFIEKGDYRNVKIVIEQSR